MDSTEPQIFVIQGREHLEQPARWLSSCCPGRHSGGRNKIHHRLNSQEKHSVITSVATTRLVDAGFCNRIGYLLSPTEHTQGQCGPVGTGLRSV